MELIDKSAVVAEIERRKLQFESQAESFRELGMRDKKDYFAALASNMHSLLSFLDTLEVKKPSLPSNLDEAAKLHRSTSSYGGDINLAMQESFKAGAQWQKQQNRETIELAEDHAYFAGKEKLREELLNWTREKFHCYDELLKEHDDPAHWGQRNAFHQVIDKINSL